MTEMQSTYDRLKEPIKLKLNQQKEQYPIMIQSIEDELKENVSYYSLTYETLRDIFSLGTDIDFPTFSEVSELFND